MDLIYLIFGLALIGCILWLILTYIPMPPIFKTVIGVVIGIVVILYILRMLAGSVPNVLPLALWVTS